MSGSRETQGLNTTTATASSFPIWKALDLPPLPGAQLPWRLVQVQCGGSWSQWEQVGRKHRETLRPKDKPKSLGRRSQEALHTSHFTLPTSQDQAHPLLCESHSFGGVPERG